MNAGTSNFLNASRWVAAFFVVFYHVYNLSFTRDHLANYGFLYRCLHFLGGFGHTAVIVFFVISGFLVGGRNILDIKTKKFDVVEYFVHRFSRIYVVFIPALIIGFMMDRLGIRLFNASGIYNHPDPFYSNPFGNNIAKHLSFDTFVGNVAQLQTISVSSLGSNGPLWSLANEWWYYVLFGLALVTCCSARLLTRIIAAGVILGMLTLLPLTISLWFMIWAIGAGVAVLDRYWAGWHFLFGATIAIVCLTAARWIDARQIFPPGMDSDFAVDLMAALGYSAALICAKNLKTPRKLWSLHRALASFSYTVYLVHFPALIFFAAMMKDVFNIGFLQQPSMTAIIYAGALVAIIYGYAWIFAVFTEARTDAVRSRLSLVVSALHHRVNSLVHTRADAMVAVPANNDR